MVVSKIAQDRDGSFEKFFISRGGKILIYNYMKIQHIGTMSILENQNPCLGYQRMRKMQDSSSLKLQLLFMASLGFLKIILHDLSS